VTSRGIVWSLQEKVHPTAYHNPPLPASGIRHPASGIRHPASGIFPRIPVMTIVTNPLTLKVSHPMLADFSSQQAI
jgi:hypothetical protein